MIAETFPPIDDARDIPLYSYVSVENSNTFFLPSDKLPSLLNQNTDTAIQWLLLAFGTDTREMIILIRITYL